MPEISGRTLAMELLKVRKTIRILYRSGYTTDAILHHGIIEEGMRLIQKPFTAGTLARTVREALDASNQ